MQHRKSLTDILVNGASTVVIKAKFFILMPFIVQLTSLEAFGAWAQAIFAAQLLAEISTCGFRDSVIRFYPTYKKQKRQGDLLFQALILPFLLFLPITTLMLTFADDISRIFLHSTIYAPMFRWACPLVIVFSVYRLLLGYLRAQDRIKLYSLIDAALQYVDPILCILALVYSKNVLALLQTSFVCYLLGIAVVGSFVLRDIPDCHFHLKGFRELLRYGLPLVPSQLASGISARGDRFIIGYFLGASAVGLYSVCYTLGNVINLFSTPIVTAMLPKIIRCWDIGQVKNVFDIIGTSIRLILSLGIATLVGLIFIAVEVIRYLTSLYVPDTISITIGFIGVGIICNSVNRIFVMLLQAKRQTVAVGVLYLVTMSVNLILNLILIPIYGILGSAIATFLAYTSFSLIVAAMLRADLSSLISSQFSAKLLFSTFVMSAILLPQTVTSLYGLVMKIISGATAFVITFVVLKPWNTETDHKIYSTFKFYLCSFRLRCRKK